MCGSETCEVLKSTLACNSTTFSKWW